MKFRTIEIARGLAAFSVALAHMPPAGILPGALGVEFFFTLSGFIMGYLHFTDLSDSRKIPSFLWKRVCRIYPIYWLTMLPLLFVFWDFPTTTWFKILNWMTLTPTVQDNLLPVAWTLRHEMFFYLMVAVGMIPRVGKPVLVVWISITFLLIFFGTPYTAHLQTLPVVHFLFHPFNSEFAIGFVAGGAARSLRLPAGAWLAILAAAVGILVWRLSMDEWGYQYGPHFARPIYGSCFAVIILALAKIEEAGLWRPGRWALLAGGASYPLYLCHTTTALYLQLYVWEQHPVGPDIVRIAYLIAVPAVAILLYLCFDKPVQRALRTLGDRVGERVAEARLRRSVPDGAMRSRS